MDNIKVDAFSDTTIFTNSFYQACDRVIYDSFTYDKYISERSVEILKILKEEVSESNKQYNFIAGLGSGKTYSMMELAIKEKIKMVIAFPLKMLRDQKVEQYFEMYPELPKYSIGNIMGNDYDRKIKGTSQNEIDDLIHKGCNLFVCVYDSIGILLSNSNFFPEDYILVIDEAHDLVTQFGFRHNAIKAITRVQNKFKRVIYISGTHEATLPYEYRTIQFVPKNIEKNNIHRGEVNLVSYNKDGLFKLFNLLINAREGTKIVFIDSDTQLNKLKLAIRNYFNLDKGTADERIGVISNRSYDPETIELLVKEQIGKEYIFCTRKIAEGVDIFGVVDSVYMLDIEDFWIKRQFLGRSRQGFRVAYDLLPYNYDNESSWENVEERYDRDKNLAIEQLRLRNKKDDWHKKTFGSKNRGFDFDPQDCIDNSYYSELTKKFILSESSILFNIVTDLNIKMKNSSRMAYEFYKSTIPNSLRLVTYSGLIDDLAIQEIDVKKYASLLINPDFQLEYPVNINDLTKLMTHYIGSKERLFMQDRIIAMNLLHPIKISPLELQNLDDAVKVNKDLIEILYKFAIDGYPLEIIEVISNQYLSGKSANDIEKMKEQFDYYFDLHATYIYDDLEYLYSTYEDFKGYDLIRMLHDKYKNIDKINQRLEFLQTKPLFLANLNMDLKRANVFIKYLKSIFTLNSQVYYLPGKTYLDPETNGRKPVPYRTVSKLYLKDMMNRYDIHIDNYTLTLLSKISAKRLLRKIYEGNEWLEYNYVIYQILEEIDEHLTFSRPLFPVESKYDVGFYDQ